ncbi:hypothetical protein [Dokdonella sp.]|uniref:hypothetical protein n=1 Tax=Dokdonella sp. TaxID=2291710 RepID=UPI003527373D
MNAKTDKTTEYQADSLSLIGAVALGTGVMIGAGIFALTGQMAEMTGSLWSIPLKRCHSKVETFVPAIDV